MKSVSLANDLSDEALNLARICPCCLASVLHAADQAGQEYEAWPCYYSTRSGAAQLYLVESRLPQLR